MGGKAEARSALADAEQSVDKADSRTREIKMLTDRVLEHGRRNHFGERIEEAIRRA